MNAIFEPFMTLKKSKIQVKLSIEGYRLAHLKPNFQVDGDDPIDLFYSVFEKFLNAKTFCDGELNLAPFAQRKIGPNWFTQDQVKKGEDRATAQRIVDEHWSNFLAVQVIPFGFPQYKSSDSGSICIPLISCAIELGSGIDGIDVWNGVKEVIYDEWFLSRRNRFEGYRIDSLDLNSSKSSNFITNEPIQLIVEPIHFWTGSKV
ncbi:hypothetical protein PIB30_012804 [Stylosanthes scabra]|uniref:Uncharacterized protein n=1 Tax=Stylosanthes scabra TaxID=79078 RepID=A0ABU6T5Z3_9FABA|nr:hypothetical protein [Stylosanthes scabra]